MEKTKRIRAVLAGLVLIFLLTGCSGSAKGKRAAYVSKSAEYFGTVVTLTLYGEDEEELKTSIDNAFGECERLEKIFSARLADSELYRLNQTAQDSAMPVSDELFFLIQNALHYHEISDGGLDISIGGLIDLWGIGTDHARIPSEQEIEPYLSRDGCRHIVLDTELQTIRYTDKLVQIDLGAVAKGYAADRLREYLMETEHISSATLNLGGNVMALGEKTDGSAFRIGLTDPLYPGEICAVISVRDRAVVTSGNYERYFMEDGKRYHHILDPQTGCPAERGIISATVIGESSMECDALSTACYVLGMDRAMELVESLDGVECVLIDEEGKLYRSSGVQDNNFEQLKRER